MNETTRPNTEPNAAAAAAEALAALASATSHAPDAPPAPDEAAEAPPVGRAEIRQAAETLRRYKEGKARLEERVVTDELWWELRHWETVRGERKNEARPSSAWLFNAILNKHADAMDNFPEPIVLPREQSDTESARTLSAVLPVLLELNGFEQTYSDNWWEKLKHGTAAYGVFWNPEKENGLGDVDVRAIDLLKLFWEPGVTDIQNSRSLFLAELMENELLEQEYPVLRGKLPATEPDLKQYLYDERVDNSGKSVVVDWYYKTREPDGRTLVHYAKFVGDTLLYASENDPALRRRGFYDHGKYPVVLDVLFPEKGTPAGFGYVAVCRDPQLYIDRLSANILENAMMATKKRFFVSTSTGVNEQEFLDWDKPLVHVEGPVEDTRLREIVTRPLDSIYVSVAQMKVEEMKDTASNRDVNAGGVTGGVTAASAIAALQEAGSKTSRDMISASYRAHRELCSLCVELIRQFYDQARSFRITGAAGEPAFASLSNAALGEEFLGLDGAGEPLFRRPVFDLKITAQRKSPFSRMEQNERAKELYALGFFRPDRAGEALAALDMMDFEGIERVREHLRRSVSGAGDAPAAGADAPGGLSFPYAETPYPSPSGGGGTAAAVGEGEGATLYPVQGRAGVSDFVRSPSSAPSGHLPPLGEGYAPYAEAENAVPVSLASLLLRAKRPAEGYVQRLASRGHGA